MSQSINLISDNVANSWANYLKRSFIPFFASGQDKKVSELFTNYLNQISDAPADKEKLKEMTTLADRHIARGKKGWFSHAASEPIARLEHYILAVRDRFNLFDNAAARNRLHATCLKDNKALHSRWVKFGFSEEAFWRTPDLVDFVFKGFLHRHITYPRYNHTISFSNQEAHLLVDGRQTAWSEIRKKIQVDSESRLFSTENGQKKRWMYLDRGLTQVPDDRIEHPPRLWKLEQPPAENQVQLVTTHAHKEDWFFADRLLKGTRHAFFRIIPGAGFAARHPEARLKDGEVYSFGWGIIRWSDLSLSAPLATMEGVWNSPDKFEFLKQDQSITPKSVTDEKLLRLMEIVRKRSKEKRPFQFSGSNCSTVTAEVLREANILDLNTKNKIADIEYKLFVPKLLRTPIKKITAKLYPVTPRLALRVVELCFAIVNSVIFAPIFTVFGAWRTHGRSTQGMRALFSNLYDLLDPSKKEIDLTKSLYKWQKRQPETVFEKRN